jgi:hypothetical protein
MTTGTVDASGTFLQGCRILIHFIRIRIQHFRLNTDPDPDPIRIQGFRNPAFLYQPFRLVPALELHRDDQGACQLANF